MRDEYDLDAMIADINAAEEVGVEKEALATRFKPPGNAQLSPLSAWFERLPKNVGIGLLDAAIATSHTIADVARNNLEVSDTVGRKAAGAVGVELPPLPDTPQWLKSADEAVLNFRNYVADGSGTSDIFTQAASQFMIPFLGWSKLLGVTKVPSIAGKVGMSLAAESASVAHSFEPAAARMADLVKYGKTLEGNMGRALNKIAPDGGLVNAFIDYMTDRSDESPEEGRFKNVVDNFFPSLALSGLFFAGAKALKLGRMKLKGELPEEAVPVAAGKPFEIEAYRGVPAGQDPLDSSKSYANSLFYTPHESVAQSYAGSGGVVAKHKLKYNNMLEAESLVDARKKLQLSSDAGLDDIVNAARKAGHDGFTFDNGTGKIGREYVSIPPLKE